MQSMAQADGFKQFTGFVSTFLRIGFGELEQYLHIL